MSVTFRPCIADPCYNHGAMAACVARLAPFDLPCRWLTTGEESTHHILAQLAEQHPQVTLLRLAKNAAKARR